MGGMMHAGLGFIWILLGLALLAGGGIWASRSLAGGRRDSSQIHTAPDALQQAKEELRLRYARGEISREDYLQGKVELED